MLKLAQLGGVHRPDCAHYLSGKPQTLVTSGIELWRCPGEPTNSGVSDRADWANQASTKWLPTPKRPMAVCGRLQASGKVLKL